MSDAPGQSTATPGNTDTSHEHSALESRLPGPSSTKRALRRCRGRLEAMVRERQVAKDYDSTCNEQIAELQKMLKDQIQSAKDYMVELGLLVPGDDYIIACHAIQSMDSVCVQSCAVVEEIYKATTSLVQEMSLDASIVRETEFKRRYGLLLETQANEILQFERELYGQWLAYTEDAQRYESAADMIINAAEMVEICIKCLGVDVGVGETIGLFVEGISSEDTEKLFWLRQKWNEKQSRDDIRLLAEDTRSLLVRIWKGPRP